MTSIMSSASRFAALTLGFCAGLLAVRPAWADETPAASKAVVRAESGAGLPNIADFFRTPLLAKPLLSPNGRFLAAGLAGEGGRVVLAVLDLEHLGQSKVIAGFGDADIDDYQWVNDHRLVFDVTDRQSGSGKPMAPGLWAVNRDGSDRRALIKPFYNFISNSSSHIHDRVLPYNWDLHSTLKDGSDEVLVTNYQFGNDHVVNDTVLARLNTRTGQVSSLSSKAPEHVMQWWVDHKGQPAALTTHHSGRYATYLRGSAGTWDLWQEGSAFDTNSISPYWFGPSGLFLAIGGTSKGTAALYQVNVAERKLQGEPLVSLDGYDFRGSLVVERNSGRLLGVHFESDARGTAWFDPAMRAVQAEVDELFPGTVNRLDCTQCADMSAPVLVTAASDRHPPVFYLYWRKDKKLDRVAASRPWIKAQQMGMRDMYRISARDGLSLPVMLTQPASKTNAPRPAVVLVHGGPWVRGNHWDWEPAAQFLASRGYLVIEPDFRGSAGYGAKHLTAGWKQWGLAMQDDVADAVNWAVSKGLADAKRVCIAGASYGGYATLMGLIKHHELYQCGINWVGVSDIELMYTINWSDFGDEVKQFSLPTMVGDREKDAAQLRATSPLHQAARLKRPLLMAYGGDDRRVPLKHGTDFRDAVIKTNPNVEWVVYPDEGHGWRKLETNVDFWGRVEKFLDRHIGSGAQ